MKRSALITLVIAAGAALLLIAAAAKSQVAIQSHPYGAASWLAAIVAFGVFAVMLAEYFIHARQIHLYLGGTFLALGIMGVWDALTFPYDLAFGARAAGAPGNWAHFGLWEWQWVTLAVMLMFGMAANLKMSSRQWIGRRAAAVIAGSVLWAAIVVFLTTTFPVVSSVLTIGRMGVIVSGACGVIFAIGCFAYSRASVCRNNAVLAWTSYGLIFAVFAQAAMALQDQPHDSLVGFAALMKVLVFLFPLAGMLAEHTRLQTRLHDQAGELDNLIRSQQAVSSIAAPADLYQRIIEIVSVSFPAKAACLMPFEKDRGLLRVAAQTGFPDDVSRQLAFRPGEGPPGNSFSKKEVLFVRDLLEDAALFQKLGDASEVRSAVFAPLIVRDECLGILALFFGGRPLQKMAKEQVRLLEMLANQAALAVDGFQMQGRMRDSAKATDDYARELEIVWEVGQAVASKLGQDELVDALAEKLARAVGAKGCSILAFEPDEADLRVMGRQELRRQAGVKGHEDQCDVIAATAVQKGEPVIANDIPNSSDCKYPDMALGEGTHHLLCVPMSLRGFAGAITVFRQNGEPFGEREKQLLHRLAPMVATGVRNAELYERERMIAEGLQKSFLPQFDREFAGIQVASQYQAAFDESLVGGDFYDVVDFGDGRYGIAIGDVTGRGVDAVVYTALTRYMIQAYSTDDPDPVYVVSKLNGDLCRYTPEGKFVTLVYGVLDTNSNTFTYTNAGHEVPFVYRSGGQGLEGLGSTGPAAGALDEAEYSSDEIPFAAGDMLIFYTDGATEARSEGKFLGTEGLRKITADHIRRGLDNLPEAMITSVRSYAKGHLRDDIAILIVKARTPGALF